MTAIRPVLDDPIARARHMLQSAQWAARDFSRFDKSAVDQVVAAVAEAAVVHSNAFAEWAVRETGFGVVEHKQLKNEFASRGLLNHYQTTDYVTRRVDTARRILVLPKPAGVVLGLTPSTNPVSTLYFKVILCLMTRNAIVVSPHPLARECSTEAAKMLAEAAVGAGAPPNVVQVVDAPSIPLVEALMVDRNTNLILATGGSGVVRAAYRSGNPAIGVGPGNAPVVVDATADLERAARSIVRGKAFDNGLLCSAESVIVVEEAVAGELSRALTRAGCHVCSQAETERLRTLLFGTGHLNPSVIGKSARWIAKEAGLRVAPNTEVLVTPIELVVDEEPLAAEKLSPIASMVEQKDFASAVRAAAATIRITGMGHSAAIHTRTPRHVDEYAQEVGVLRVIVNAPNGTGVAGIDTHLAPTMTVGTGFVGRSSLGENLEPRHLVNWRRVAYASDTAVDFPNVGLAEEWTSARSDLGTGTGGNLEDPALRQEIRRLLVEELRAYSGAGR